MSETCGLCGILAGAHSEHCPYNVAHRNESVAVLQYGYEGSVVHTEITTVDKLPAHIATLLALDMAADDPEAIEAAETLLRDGVLTFEGDPRIELRRKA